MSESTAGRRTRRKLGKSISLPIESFIDKKNMYDRLIFIEKSNTAALKTRAAALMYIGRNDLGLTTKVKGDEVWIMKDRDILDETTYVDLRV